MKRPLLAIALCLALSCDQGGSVTLAWDPGEPRQDIVVVGYRLHWGLRSGEYLFSEYVGPVTEYVLRGLPWGVPVYVVVTALDESGSESPWSNEVSVTVER